MARLAAASPVASEMEVAAMEEGATATVATVEGVTGEVEMAAAVKQVVAKGVAATARASTEARKAEA